MEPQASLLGPAEQDAWAQGVTSVSTRFPTADIEDEYLLSQGALDMAFAELGWSSPQVDVFGSGALRKCPRVQTKGDKGWKRGSSSDPWKLLYIHAPRSSLQPLVAKIARDRARAVVTIPSWEIGDAKDAPAVQERKCITLINTQLSSAEDNFVDAPGNPLPPHARGWTTTVAYVDGSLGDPDGNMGTSSITARVQPERCRIVERPNRSVSRIRALMGRRQPIAGIALRRWHKKPCRRMSWTSCVGTCQVPCTWGSHHKDRPPSPGGKNPRFVRDASRRTSMWSLCWSTGRTRKTKLGPIRQCGVTCTGPHEATTSDSSQPTVAKVFKMESSSAEATAAKHRCRTQGRQSRGTRW